MKEKIVRSVVSSGPVACMPRMGARRLTTMSATREEASKRSMDIVLLYTRVATVRLLARDHFLLFEHFKNIFIFYCLEA